MNTKKHYCLIAFLAFTLASSLPAHSAQWFVSPNGNDKYPGTLAKPFATIERAQQEARKLAGKEASTVYLRAGTYYLTTTLMFTTADSGTAHCPTTYSAYQNEPVVISGGERLKMTWTPYRDGIMMANTPADLATDQLFVNGSRRILARYPNYVAGQILGGYSADAFSLERAKRWADPTGGYIHAMQALEWGDLHYLITGKDANGNVNYIGGWQNNRQMGMHADQKYVENIFEELDAPDEWFLNQKTHVLYYYPPPGLDLSRATIESARLTSLVNVQGDIAHPVRNLRLEGITFRHTLRTFMDNKEPLLRSDWTIYRGGALFFTGTESCLVKNCNIEDVGGNALFVSNYNRALTIKGCYIPNAGSNGIAFVGDPKSVRSPLFEYNQQNSLSDIDLKAGPKTKNYPADCLVDDCLIDRSGRFELQTAPIEIDMAARITVRHCSIYDVPRAGINIGDGCWGGDIIEYCDVFDTVKETGDHGSFNSWGRDRYWNVKGLNLNDDAEWTEYKGVPFLDVVQPITLRNSRWRCDHGWDIDLDDGSSNYRIYDNLCLNGGIKNREGYGRIVENNVIVNNTYHPHVWFVHSGDIFRHNIVCCDFYRPAGMPTDRPWGSDMDDNFVNRPGSLVLAPAFGLMAQSHRDSSSLVGDALFVNPGAGNFSVANSSPALKLGFVNFPMDEFGVVSPRLKAIAHQPEIPEVVNFQDESSSAATPPAWESLLGARVRNISGLGDRSVYGLPSESGVLIIDSPEGSESQLCGLQSDDVIIEANDQQVSTIADLVTIVNGSNGKAVKMKIIRHQNFVTLNVAIGATFTQH